MMASVRPICLSALSGRRAGGQVDVASNEEGRIAALFEEAVELGGGGGFAGAVETDYHQSQQAVIGERSRVCR